MAFPGAISGGNLTNMRGAYQGRSFLLATPEDIVFQAVLPALSDTYAEITYGAIQQGAYTAVLADMVYTITTGTTDFNNPTIRGYIRVDAADATKIYIDVQDDTLASGYYITVFNDYDVFPRKPRRSFDVNYVDYDKAFERLPPYIADIQSVYVEDTTAASATIVFAPTCTAMADGATISSYLWVVDDGTITVGTSTDKDVTISFPAGHRWVTFSTTDSNGNSHTIHFEVYVGDLITAAFTLHGAESLQWSGDFDGYSGSANMFADVDAIVDNQRLTIAVLDTNNGTAGAINTNIALVGRYRIENTKTTGGDSTSRNTQDSNLAIEGFGQSLANLPVPKFNITDVDVPAVWNDIIDPSPLRLVWHTLTRYTTAANLMSFDALATDLNYKSGAIAVSSQGCLSALNQVLERVNAQCNFSSDGTLRVRRDTNFLADSDRSALTTIADITTQDITSYQLDNTYNDTVGQVTGGGLHYNTTNKEYVFYIAKAPTIISTIGEEIQQINGQVLDSTDTADDATSDLQTRVASKLAQGRSVTQLSLDLFDSWRFLTPSNYDRYNVTIPATLNLRSNSYDTTTFWQLRSISCTANIKEGNIQTRGVFVQETFAGTAGRVVTIVPAATDVEIPIYPIMQDYSGDFNVDGSLFNVDDSDGNDWGVTPESKQANEPKDTDTIIPIPVAGQGVYIVWMPESDPVTTTFSTVAGAIYQIDVGGDGIISTSDAAYNMLSGNGQGESSSYGGGLYGEPDDEIATGAGEYETGADRYNSVASSIDGVCTNIQWPVPADAFVKSVSVTWLGYRPAAVVKGDKNCGITLRGYGGDTIIAGPSFGIGTSQTISRTRTEGTNYDEDLKVNTVLVHGSMDRDDGIVRISVFNVVLRESTRGDAFFYDYNNGDAVPYATGNGLLINGVTIADTIEIVYYSNHAYTFNITGTGSPITFVYGDTTSYTDNDWSPIVVSITGLDAK